MVKEMKKYYVGKPRRKTAIILMIIYMAFDLFCLYGYLNARRYPQTVAYEGMELNLLVIIIALFLMTFLLIGPMMYTTSLWWSVDLQKLNYCNYSGYLSRLKAFYLPKYSRHYFISISTKEIESVTLSWQSVSRYIFGIYAHPIYFHIVMSDGTELHLEALLGRKSKDFIQAVDFMKDQGIQFNDPYHLLEVIANPHMSVAQYIDELEKREHHD